MKLSDFQKRRLGKTLLTVMFVLISLIYIFPVLMVVINSFKDNTFVKTETFAMPNEETFVGFDNFIKAAAARFYNRFKVKKSLTGLFGNIFAYAAVGSNGDLAAGINHFTKVDCLGIRADGCGGIIGINSFLFHVLSSV